MALGRFPRVALNGVFCECVYVSVCLCGRAHARVLPVCFPCCSGNKCSISQSVVSSWGLLIFIKMGILGEFLKDTLIFQVTYCRINILKPNNFWTDS